MSGPLFSAIQYLKNARIRQLLTESTPVLDRRIMASSWLLHGQVPSPLCSSGLAAERLSQFGLLQCSRDDGGTRIPDPSRRLALFSFAPAVSRAATECFVYQKGVADFLEDVTSASTKTAFKLSNNYGNILREAINQGKGRRSLAKEFLLQLHVIISLLSISFPSSSRSVVHSTTAVVLEPSGSCSCWRVAGSLEPETLPISSHPHTAPECKQNGHPDTPPLASDKVHGLPQPWRVSKKRLYCCLQSVFAVSSNTKISPA